MSVKSFLDGTDYGQCENLCDRLNSILRKYPHDVSIFKEFIQNADDAGASEIVFILDHRKFECQDGRLFGIEPEWKSIHECPSLLVYNNRKFSEDDITGITKLGRGNKEFSPELIGRFGIGFNVAYHVTDCPTFVSYSSGGVPENYCVLDPGGLYVPGHSLISMRGRRFKIDSAKLQQFSKEFEPFDGDIFAQMSKLCENCFSDIQTGFSNGFVVFRLPFTRSISNYKSNLKDGFEMNSTEMGKLFKTFSNNAEDLVMFLSNIKSISAFEITTNGTCIHRFTTSGSLSAKDALICKENTALVQQEITTLREITRTVNDGQSNELPDSFEGDSTMQHDISLKEISWNYQLEIQTLKHKIDTNSHKRIPDNTTSLWLISQHFGSHTISPNTLIAAFSSGLIPKGGVAIKLSGDITAGRLYCSLPLPHYHGLPVHINGSFLVDDSRKRLDYVASQSPLFNWNQCLMQSVICSAYVDGLLYCKRFVNDKGTNWYYSKFPRESNLYSSYNLDIMVYSKIIVDNLLILQKDSVTESWSWLPVIGSNCGYFFSLSDQKILQLCSEYGDSEVCKLEVQLREVLMEIGVNLTKAPVAIHSEISKVASACKLTYDTMIHPVSFIKVLKSLRLQHHKDTISKNIILLLRYCLSTKEGCDAVDGAPLLLTCGGDVQKLAPTVYGSKYAPLLPHKPNKFIHSKLEQDEEIIKVLIDKEFYMPIPEIQFVGMNSQLINCGTPVNIEECQEYHRQIIEHWKFIDEYTGHVIANQLESCLKGFDRKPIIPSSNRMLVPVCRAKMVLSPESEGHDHVKNIMKHFGFPVLDFSILCNMTFENYTNALCRVLTDTRNGNDSLNCIKLNNLSQIVPLKDDLRKYLQHFFNTIATSSLLPSVSSFLCKLPIFEAVTGDLHAITALHSTYHVPFGIPDAGLSEVMTSSSMLLLKSLPMYNVVYQSMGIQCCDIANFYVNVVIPNFQIMSTIDIIIHVKFLFVQSFNSPTNLYNALEGSRFIYVASGDKWCFVREFCDPEQKLFSVFLKHQFPPEEWNTRELLPILRQLGLQQDILWEQLFSIAKYIEGQIDGHIICQRNQSIYDQSAIILESISTKLKSIKEGDNDAVEAASEFCMNISEVIFVPTHKNDAIILETFPPECNTRCWTSFSDACFAASANLTFLQKDVIVASFDLSKSGQLHQYVTALGIEFPPLCTTVIYNLFELSRIAQLLVQSSRQQQIAIRNFLRKLFRDHYIYLEDNATDDELLLLKNKVCMFVESTLTYAVVNGGCVVKKHQPASLFPYLCQISDDILECQKITAALDICDEPNSCHYANILKKIYTNFPMLEIKLSDNPKYSELAKEAMDCLIESLHGEEATVSVPDAFSTAELYLLDKQLELYPVDQLVYDDVPWFSRRLQNVTYKYMRDPPIARDRHGGITLPQSLGVKLLSSLVVEKLDDGVLSPDNECQEEQFVHDRGQPNHGCPYVLTLEKILLSAEFKMGVLRIIHHQKNTELTEAEISLAEKLGNLQFCCYYEINTILKRKDDNSVIQGSSDSV